MGIADGILKSISKEAKIAKIGSEINPNRVLGGLINTAGAHPQAYESAMTKMAGAPAVSALEATNAKWAAKQASKQASGVGTTSSSAYIPKPYENRIAEKMAVGMPKRESAGQLGDEIIGSSHYNGSNSKYDGNDIIPNHTSHADKVSQHNTWLNDRAAKTTAANKAEDLTKYNEEVRTRISKFKATDGSPLTSNAARTTGFTGPMQTPGTKPIGDGWQGALKSGMNSIFANISEGKGLGQVGTHALAGGILGGAAGVGTSMASFVDPNTFQSNGVIKPMMQGAWKGALLGAVGAGAGRLTTAQMPEKYKRVTDFAKMTQKVANSGVTKAAIAASVVGSAGGMSLTRPNNPIK